MTKQQPTIVVDSWTEQGLRSVQQDRVFTTTTFMTDETDETLAILCDGHGPYGETVARFVVDILPTKYLAFFAHRHSHQEALARAIAVINDSAESYHGGTTIILAHVKKKTGRVLIAQVGDSLCYHCNPLPNLVLQPHSLATPAEVQHIPPKHVVGKYIRYFEHDHTHGIAVTRAVGDHEFRPYGVLSTPEFAELTLLPGEQLLLATDGVWGAFSPEELAAFFGRDADPVTLASRLHEAWLQRCSVKQAENNSMDNGSCITLLRR